MLLSSAVLAVLIASGDETRRPVLGGVYESWGCAEVGLPSRSRFEDYQVQPSGTLATKDFICALALYVDSPGITPEEKFSHLASQARRGEKWGAALSGYMAKLDWKRYLNEVYQRAGSLRPDEWLAVSFETATYSAAHPEMEKEFPPRLARLFYEQALHNSNVGVRHRMTSWLARPWATVEQALALARRLPEEDDPDVRSMILWVQASHDDPRTNIVLRDFLRGPYELPVLVGLSQGYKHIGSVLVAFNRHDFLPDLGALRDRLAAEKDVRKRYEARQGVELLDKLIPVLEKKKEENAPICPARRSGK